MLLDTGNMTKMTAAWWRSPSFSSYLCPWLVAKMEMQSSNIVQNFWWDICLDLFFKNTSCCAISSQGSLKHVTKENKDKSKFVNSHYRSVGMSLKKKNCYGSIWKVEYNFGFKERFQWHTAQNPLDPQNILIDRIIEYSSSSTDNPISYSL